VLSVTELASVLRLDGRLVASRNHGGKSGGARVHNPITRYTPLFILRRNCVILSVDFCVCSSDGIKCY